MSNKSEGNKLENLTAKVLFNKGYWVHIIQQNKAGQPADLIAGKNGQFLLIDCKACAGDKFVLSRIEYNQHQAMRLFKARTKGNCLFAISLQDRIYFIEYERLNKLEVKSVGADWLKENNMEEL